MKFFLIFLIVFASKAANGIEINCYFSSDYDCEVISIDTSDGSPEVLAVSGNHDSGKSNEDVKRFFMYRSDCQNLNSFPSNLSFFFPNLEKLNLRGCNITTLNGDVLQEFPGLLEFDFEDTFLKHVPGNLFDNLLSLERISFEDNQVKFIF